MEKSSDVSDNAGPSNVPSLKIGQKIGSNAWPVPSGSNMFKGSNDVTLFSSSLPLLPHEKYADLTIQSMDDVSSEMREVNKDSVQGSLDDSNVHVIGSMLPDDEEALLAGVVEDFDLSELPGQVEDLEDFDIFGSGGGMELDLDPMENLTSGISSIHLSDGYFANGITHYGLSNGSGAIVGEHPFGEHPSRTLFVRNINSNVEDSELRSLFEQYGDIRTMYTTCKNRGFVMISYYDIRAARTAMRALQNKPLRRRKLDIHFSIPKENPSEKDLNQGTLVIFNLDPSVSNDDLLQLFGNFGEVKEIRETPHKRHHKFIEFYDARAAEAALRALNKSDIAGKRIKLEPSRPGGARRSCSSESSLIQQMSQEIEKDDNRIYGQLGGSPIANSPPGIWTQSPIENDSFSSLSRSTGTSDPIGGNYLPGLASLVPSSSNSMKIAPIGKEQNRINLSDHVNSNQLSQGLAFQHPHSFPERSEMMLSMVSNTENGSPFPRLNASGVGAVTGSQSLWGSPPFSDFSHPSSWQSMRHQIPSNAQGQGQRTLYPGHVPFIGSPSSHNHLYHHVGSAPSGISFERPFGYFSEPPGASFLSPSPFGSASMGRNDGSLTANMGTKAPLNHGVALSGNILETSPSNFRLLASHRLGNSLFGSVPFPGVDGVNERARNRRAEGYGTQLDSKKQYQLNLEKIINGEDTRTTLMIKNIPNKYTSKMLLATIDENHKGSYDFLYLPIDFKNKCNVGYAFINMLSPSHILPFHQTFNGKKWEKFNSEKVASLAYARIQGKVALVSHFQNSSLMNEDKRCRPILFHSEGSEAGNEEPVTSVTPVGLNIFVRQQDGTILGDAVESPNSFMSEKREKSSLNGGIIP
ncbi:protein MEI2-like 2 isoform X2 [Phalaenopsis equestris]|uniref:protein MEI2-like 2 isoform X2 n=1 Tax=Phalaenopsis equestris TaxID=78828 RepID=UPI0009E36F86|nr:protein MEI2-like 2 isoform X2 [Phalaenopsis equestris]